MASPASDLPTVVARFAARALEAPDVVALVDGTERLTYAELDARSARFAAALRARGAGPAACVALVSERSAAAVVAMLAVLRAGAAYVPLEPSYPPARLAAMLAVSGATLVLADAPNAARLPAAASQVLPLGPELWSGVDLALDLPAPGPEDRAYVMFTSGSTGEPKGVEVPHRAIERLVCGVDYATLGPGATLLHAAPLAFDASTFEVWGALLTGGRCVVHPERVPTPEGLAEVIAREGVTTAWLTAGLFNAVVDDDPTRLTGLRELLIGGEALSAAHVRRAQAALSRTRLINGYGPTETTTFAACHPIPAPLPADATSVPIGRAIRDTHLYVLDESGRQVTPGAEGELYIGGRGVALGYASRPDLTAERFLPDPFAGGTGGRMYRTGDRVRELPDGALEYLGRADAQVKISGYRIELGEIEAVLASQPGVRRAVVVARPGSGGAPARLVAYVVPADFADVPSVDALRGALRETLPTYMVPSAFVSVPEVPLTPNGKVDARALPDPAPEPPTPLQASDASAAERAIAEVWGALLGAPVAVDVDVFDRGATSLLVLRARTRLREAHRLDLPATWFFSHRTPRALAARAAGMASPGDGPVHGTSALGGATAAKPSAPNAPVAIVGMAARLPGAPDVETFWTNLLDGVDSVARFSPEELAASGVDAATAADPRHVPARGVVEGADLFDAEFFGVPPREAALTDPQQRLFLELAWTALEHAGYVPETAPGPVGVFAGVYNNSYAATVLARRPDVVAAYGAFNAALLGEKDYVATRAAHRLGLTGPAVSVHTACSTSLVALAQAVDALRLGRCDLALAGAVALTFPQRAGHLHLEHGMLSADGHTRPFDADATGTVFSDGGAVIALKRLADAERDGDTVYAVVRGAGLNNDGADRASFSAPSASGQAGAVAAALADAGVRARDVSYVEAHGTATPLGDPIEVDALTRVFRADTADHGFCTLGSVKSNVGHTVVAAGAAGVIKTALALTREVIPGTQHFRAPNPHLALDASPFRVTAASTPWPRTAQPRLAGVSSFGVGGTNAHVVLEEAPARPAPTPGRVPQLLVLSARTPAALDRATDALAEHLTAHADLRLTDVAHTLQRGRRAFAHRRAVAATSVADAAQALAARDQRCVVTRHATGAPGVAFLFPGQGAQYPRMGARLYADEPAFRRAFDRVASAVQPVLGDDLRRLLDASDGDALRDTRLAQPAIFATAYATAELWRAWGVSPRATLGHSVGEFVGAALAGVMTPEDAARLVAERGRLMQALPPGAMLSVRLPVDAIAPRLGRSLAIAAENGPTQCVVAGPASNVERLQAELEADGVACRPLRTSHAFHSPMMDAAVEPFARLVGAAPLSPPRVPFVSSVTGRWVTEAEATDPMYWARHLREPVRFGPALATLAAESELVLLEVGPRATLTALARQQLGATRPCTASMGDAGDPDGEPLAMRDALGRLWAAGVTPDWRAVGADEERRRVPLPTYPFERRRHWIDADDRPTLADDRPTAAPEPAVSAALPPAPPVISAPATAARADALAADLRRLVEDVSGVDATDAGATFLELGLDSLALTQVALAATKRWGVRVTLRELLERHPSPAALAAHLDAALPPAAPAPAPAAVPAPAPAPAVVPNTDAQAAPVAPSAAVTVPTPAAAPVAAAPVFAPAALPAVSGPMPLGASADLRGVIDRQLDLMARQLALLSGAQAFAPTAVATPAVAAPAPTLAPATPVPATGAAATAPPAVAASAPEARTAPVAAPASEATPAPNAPAVGPNRGVYDAKQAFGAAPRITVAAAGALSPRQRARLDAFVRRYTARTAGSKRSAEANRARLADPRVATGFRPAVKELVYPLVMERSAGARMWDLDGNEYVDVLSGFGSNLFGWSPPFVVDAVKAQLDCGYDVGPQHPLAGEAAALFCEVTGHERAAFCNTGSEAVLGAVRVARTVTGRDTVVVFSGAYHGINDEALVRPGRGGRAVAAAPGILPSSTQNVLVLEWGSDAALQVIRDRADELAAVIVEPVQSRRPDFQPAAFLRALREITEQAGIVYVWDEIVTGFRAAPGGAQEYFGIRADLATYGKIVGGGMPIGVIAGRREFMDALDGGPWQFGDDSVPSVGVTYFAGTFVRHPLALAAACAMLRRLRDEGPALQRGLAERTRRFADDLNAFFRESGAPLEIRHFTSLWRAVYTADQPHGDLLYYMLRERGVHVYDGFPCFTTTAHGDAELAHVAAAFRGAVAELQEGGFLPPPPNRVLAPAADVAGVPVPLGTPAPPAEAPAAGAPPVPGARLGRDRDGSAAWFAPDPVNAGRFVRVAAL